MTSQYRLLSRAVPTAALAFLVLVLPVVADAGTCGWSAERTPSRAVDEQLWGGLQPTEPDGLPSDRDTTFYDRNGAYTHTKPFWRSLDVEDGYVFAGYNLGLHIYDARGNNAPSPKRVATFKVDSLPTLELEPHDYFLINDVSVPDGNSDLLVMTGWDAIGMVVMDVSDKTRPQVLYQDGGNRGGVKYGEGVHAMRIGARYYGFMAAQRFDGAGLWMYDLTKAQEVGDPIRCSEERPQEVNPACAGVFLEKLSNDPMSHVTGAGTSTLGHFVAFSGGLGGFSGMEIWEVSNPAKPVRRVTGLDDRRVDDIEMWVRGSGIYLAVTLRYPDEVRIYDVSCLADGCGGNPLAAEPLYEFAAPGTGLTSRMSASYSESDGEDYLFIGRSASYVVEGLQAEWLLNVTDPSKPFDLVGGDPQDANSGQPTMVVDGATVGYWSWYYACNPTGSNSFEPAAGRVEDGYFYRAGSSILDVHQVQAVNPRIDVAPGSTSTWQNTPVSFVANAFNCTPDPLGWSWSADGGSVSGSGSQVSISWSSTGTKTVSATNSGCPSATVDPVAVSVATAAPSVASVTSDVSSALVCSPVGFTANGVDGKPDLVPSWEILDGSGAVLQNATLTLDNDGLSAVWDTAADQPAPGNYTARFTVQNDTDSASKTSAPVAIASPGDLGFSAPIGTSVSFGDVEFQANSTGATEWDWSFGDGTSQLLSDPVTGPAPEHTYDAVGSYEVTVRIRNCTVQEWVESEPVTVVINEVNPLEILEFKARAPFGFYLYETGEAITFTTRVEGDPEFYDYDWDGDGSFEDSGNTAPVTTHAYDSAGEYEPVLRIRRGQAQKVAVHSPVLQVTQGDPPSIAISGPTAGTVGTSYAFRATASNCNPSNGTWTWQSGGGTLSGSGSSVTISWSSGGVKTVRVSNSACGSAGDSHTITIRSESPPPTGELDARFSVSPTRPDVGTEVEFDASSSGGDPDFYNWDFGDGEDGTGDTVDHTFQNPGTYTVRLEVSKRDPSCSFGLCTDTTTRQVTVEAAGPQTGDNGCTGELADDPTMLCLGEGRFQISVSWRDHHNGDRTGVGKAIRFGDSEGTGFFWFFNKENVELIVKIIDGTANNGYVWVFFGGLSDVYYQLQVLDTDTGNTKTYENLEGAICGRADTSALGVGAAEAAAFTSSGALPFAADPSSSGGVDSVTAAAFRPDVPDDPEDDPEPTDTLTLLDDRFEVTVDFLNQHDDDAPGVGTAVPGTNKTGYFWFFNPANLDLAVKMIDGRAANGHFWVFWGALSDVNYTVTIRDTVTGDEWTRTNPPGSFCGGADTTAFDG